MAHMNSRYSTYRAGSNKIENKLQQKEKPFWNFQWGAVFIYIHVYLFNFKAHFTRKLLLSANRDDIEILFH